MKDKKWILLMLAGWSTLVVSLFLAGLAGEAANQLLGLSGNSRTFVQGIVMSGLVVPIILYLYPHVYKITGVKSKPSVYSWKRLPHFMTGVLLAIALASLGFIIARSQGWVVIDKWHTPDQWLAALLTNLIVAFLFEALPEELGLRGMLYDLLRHRFAAWLAVLFQIILFILVPMTATGLQVLFGLAPGNTINVFYVTLILSFGTCLQLLRLWTGSLWASIGFHLAYLEIIRFVFSPHQYGGPIITFHESMPGLVGSITMSMIIIGGIIVSLVILGAKRFIRKSEGRHTTA
ncbi:CPBP family intramembrane glutamic endopeptidase [Paenibacillus thiaminolyticus]|uniref:CPBP family intramembrane glutamic endopeptidase n=1 Tax=Paenibacillus thiaminolyticus TaxID=49283 RepID=UPI00254389AD|nr:CPBP family intramembrane glutamic endopeptidase [Paenibacillus thiaminolyticus]WII35010.1 CPBP family intramembrane metalloprotease [Paenibacillus thiaminolyticus]